MSKRAQVQFEGLRELRTALARMSDGVADLKPAHEAAARVVRDAARPRAPVVTGALRESIRYSGTKRGGYVRAGKKRVPYAGPIHFGWPARNIAAQPFFYEAMDRRETQVIVTFEKHLNKVRRKYGL